jgi:uncharacterized protein (DUF1697 family)
MKYLALLRGINVGGNNRVAMNQLRLCFEELGFKNVATYINSGNVIFETAETNEVELVKKIEHKIEDQFGFKVVVMVISKTNFKNAMQNRPSWWGEGDSKKLRSDAMFVIAPTTAQEVLQELKIEPGSPDKLSEHGQVIFWTLPMENYNKSVVPKIIGTPIYKRVTLRSSTTTKKLLTLMEAT